MQTTVGIKVVIVNNRGELLLLRRAPQALHPGIWSLPGGGLENGEDPQKGLEREVREETRLAIVDIKPVHAFSQVDNDIFHVVIGYQAKAIMPAVTLNEEHDQYQWVTKEAALEEETLHPQLKELITKVTI